MSRSTLPNSSGSEAEKYELFKGLISGMQEEYPHKIYIIPTSLAVTKAAVLQVQGELPGVKSLHKMVTGEDRSIWRDHRGHLGTGFDAWKAMSYSTLYQKSPELIENEINFAGGQQAYPSNELDSVPEDRPAGCDRESAQRSGGQQWRRHWY